MHCITCKTNCPGKERQSSSIWLDFQKRSLHLRVFAFNVRCYLNYTLSADNIPRAIIWSFFNEGSMSYSTKDPLHSKADKSWPFLTSIAEQWQEIPLAQTIITFYTLYLLHKQKVDKQPISLLVNTFIGHIHILYIILFKLTISIEQARVNMFWNYILCSG